MNLYERLEQMKINKEIKYSDISLSLGITRQALHYHIKNLKKGNITFNGNQIKKISEVTGIQIENFF